MGIMRQGGGVQVDMCQAQSRVSPCQHRRLICHNVWNVHFIVSLCQRDTSRHHSMDRHHACGNIMFSSSSFSQELSNLKDKAIISISKQASPSWNGSCVRMWIIFKLISSHVMLTRCSVSPLPRAIWVCDSVTEEGTCQCHKVSSCQHPSHHDVTGYTPHSTHRIHR